MSEPLMAKGALPPLAAPARRALQAAEIADLAQLAQHSRNTIAALHGIGANALRTLEAALSENGLRFK